MERVRALQNMSRLTFLDLSGTSVDDDKLHFMSGLKGLQILWLDSAVITDSGTASTHRRPAYNHARCINFCLLVLMSNPQCHI